MVYPELVLIESRLRDLENSYGRNFRFYRTAEEIYYAGNCLGFELVDGELVLVDSVGLIFLTVVDESIYRFGELNVDTNADNIFIEVTEISFGDSVVEVDTTGVDLRHIRDTGINVFIEVRGNVGETTVSSLEIDGVY